MEMSQLRTGRFPWLWAPNRNHDKRAGTMVTNFSSHHDWRFQEEKIIEERRKWGNLRKGLSRYYAMGNVLKSTTNIWDWKDCHNHSPADNNAEETKRIDRKEEPAPGPDEISHECQECIP